VKRTRRGFLFGAIRGNNSQIGRFHMFGYGGGGDAEHGIRTGKHVGAMTLTETAEFIFA
jgi:hypothetical protein